MRSRRHLAVIAAAATILGTGSLAGRHLLSMRRAQAQGTVLQAQGQPKERDLRLFRVAPGERRILGPAQHVDGYLRLRLLSVTMDQPEYWPNEKVRVKVMAPTSPKLKVTVTWQKRDATPRKAGPLMLDDGGVAVVQIMDGAKEKNQLGEYRVEVKGPDDAVLGATTFNVVEGNLGALSFAYEFRQVTTVDELDKAKGAWFLGNAAGAGRRWGNGLSFKNELRVDNKPYGGPVELASRCMLPGCNGIDAGPRVKLDVKNGQLAATMDVGGHSGPFQIEVITPRGSLRHQFEGSSHVERDMVQVSMGLGWEHRAGLAPYTGTVQVPGRQIFVDSKPGNKDDAFELGSIVAAGGKVGIKVRKALTGAAGYVWTPRPDGKFEVRPFTVPSSVKAGAVIEAPVAQPFSLVAVGGFAGDRFFEGFALAFPPAELKLQLDVAAAGAPLTSVPVQVTATADGKPVRVSGILEAYDNRVASKSPSSPLASAIGDSMRNAAARLDSWVDQLELERQQAEMRKRGGVQKEEEKYEAAPSPMAPPSPPASMPSGVAATRGMMRKGIGGRGGALAAGRGPAETETEGEPMRQGEQKVVYCERVQTDAAGSARVSVTLPPQLGRVSFRFVAVRQMDHATVEKQVDVSKKAYAELKTPNGFVPGARLELPLTVSNATGQPLTLQLSGAGFKGVDRRTVAPGTLQDTVHWKAVDGVITLVLSDSNGKVLDRRQLEVHDVSHQPVTLSRLQMGGGQPVTIQPGESLVAYQGPGQLLGGIVNNMVTTMYSWFGHAEAISAQAAVRAVLLAAIDRRLISGEALEQTLRVDLDKSVRHLKEQFFDAATGMVRPYPGLQPDPLWTAWTAHNLHAAVHALNGAPGVAAQLREAVADAQQMAAAMDGALARRKLTDDERGGNGAGGQELLPVEVDGKVVWRVLTDDAVQRFALEKVMPLMDPAAANCELAFARAYDKYRFLRAFERTGALQYALETAKALWMAGPKARAEFDRLFAVITRGMVFTQEPGLIQGPALLGGIYSSPMAMVRFLELMLMMSGERAVAASASVEESGKKRSLSFGERFEAHAKATLTLPSGAVARIDHGGTLDMSRDDGKPPFARAELGGRQLTVARETGLTITLDKERSPMEYYAVIAVPTTTAVKQTEDILSDYKGQLIYGQQGTGGSKIQVLAVPFRGSRTMKLWLEGLLPGTSDGLVAVRHIDNVQDVCVLRLRDVTVR